MQMKISEERQNSIIKNIKYIALLGGLLALVASYFLGYSNVKVSNDELKAEIEVLDARLADLKEKKKNQKKYEEGIKTFTEDTDKIMAGFDAGLSPERIIMDYQKLCEDLDVTMSQIAFTEPQSVYTFAASGTPTAAEGDTTAIAELAGYSKTSNITITGTYTMIKGFLTKLMDSAARRRVPSNVSFSFDSAINSVTCSVSLTEYAIVGGGREESVPEVPTINKGVNNIFFANGISVVQ